MVYLAHKIYLVFQITLFGQLLYPVHLSITVDIGAHHHHPDALCGVHLSGSFHQ